MQLGKSAWSLCASEKCGFQIRFGGLVVAPRRATLGAEDADKRQGTGRSDPSRFALSKQKATASWMCSCLAIAAARGSKTSARTAPRRYHLSAAGYRSSRK